MSKKKRKFAVTDKKISDAKKLLEYLGISTVGMYSDDIYFMAQEVAEKERQSMAALYAEKSRGL